jgi:hypothetical protein
VPAEPSALLPPLPLEPAAPVESSLLHPALIDAIANAKIEVQASANMVERFMKNPPNVICGVLGNAKKGEVAALGRSVPDFL